MSAKDLKSDLGPASIFNEPSQGSTLDEGQLRRFQSNVKVSQVAPLHFPLNYAAHYTTADVSKTKVSGQYSGQGSNAAGVPASLPALSVNGKAGAISEAAAASRGLRPWSAMLDVIHEEPEKDKEPEEDEEPEEEVWYRIKEPLTDGSCSTGNAFDSNAVPKPQDSTKSMGLGSSALPKFRPASLSKPGIDHIPKTFTNLAVTSFFGQPAFPPKSGTSFTKQATYTTMPTTYSTRPPHPGRPPTKQVMGSTKPTTYPIKQAMVSNPTASTTQPIQAAPTNRKRKLSFSDDGDQDGDLEDQNRAKRVNRGRSIASKPATAAMANTHGYRNIGILPWSSESL